MASIDRSHETDVRIVAALRRDARQTNVALAKRLGLTEGAVRRRIDNLLAAGAIKFVAVADPVWSGTPVQALLRIRCAPHLIDDVIESLRHLPELDRVYHCTGSFDLTAVGAFESTGALREFTVGRLGAVTGIVELQSELILESIESTFDSPDDISAPTGDGVVLDEPAESMTGTAP